LVGNPLDYPQDIAKDIADGCQFGPLSVVEAQAVAAPLAGIALAGRERPALPFSRSVELYLRHMAECGRTTGCTIEMRDCGNAADEEELCDWNVPTATWTVSPSIKRIVEPSTT